MRTLDQIYWDCECTRVCTCRNLEEALRAHPRLKELRDGQISSGDYPDDYKSWQMPSFYPTYEEAMQDALSLVLGIELMFTGPGIMRGADQGKVFIKHPQSGEDAAHGLLPTMERVLARHSRT